MKRILAYIFCFLVLCSTLSAGPFGLEFGWSIDDMIDAGVKLVNTSEDTIRYALEKERETGWQYTVIALPIDIIPPSPSDMFTHYQIMISYDLGIYRIIAYEGSSVIYADREDDDNYALSLRRAEEIFNRVNNSLFIKYGEGRNFFSNKDHKFWDWQDNQDNLDIELEFGESRTFSNTEEFSKALDNYDTIDQYNNGKYYVQLEYDQSEYLQAVKDAEIF